MVLPQSLTPPTKPRTGEQTIFRHTRTTTSPIAWCVVIVSMILTILIIFSAIAILVIFLTLRPKTPSYDTPAASLASIYVNPPGYLNGDFTFMANMSNPNRRLTVVFEYARVELYFSRRLLAAQALEPFRERPGDARAVAVHMLPILVYLPPNVSTELQRQWGRNRVVFHVRGAFRVRVEWGVLHYSYSLHGACRLEITTGPPTSALVSRSCTTKR